MIQFLNNPMTMEYIEKVGNPLAIMVGAISTVGTRLAEIGGLPTWANGPIAYVAILVLVYLLKYAIGLWQAKDDEVRRMNAEQIKALQSENEKLRNENDLLRRVHEHEHHD